MHTSCTMVSALVVAGFVAMMLLGMEVAIAFYAADRQWAARVLAVARRWIAGHARVLMIVVCLVLGAYLVVRGAAGLVTS
jgi:hypothetical protein